MGQDPQQARLKELLAKIERGTATDAEREELELYDAEDLAEAGRTTALTVTEKDDGWMERVASDKRIKAAESTRFVRAERAVGYGLFLAGFLTGGLTMFPGVAILLWSYARVRWRTHKQDPYSKVEE